MFYKRNILHRFRGTITYSILSYLSFLPPLQPLLASPPCFFISPTPSSLLRVHIYVHVTAASFTHNTKHASSSSAVDRLSKSQSALQIVLPFFPDMYVNRPILAQVRNGSPSDFLTTTVPSVAASAGFISAKSVAYALRLSMEDSSACD